MSAPEFYMIDGKPYKPVVIPATGQWQLMEMKASGLYVLVHPNGRQAWFHTHDVAKVARSVPKFRFTANPMMDLRKLIKGGLVPFHVDADFDVGALT